jgi:predicted Rossmann fold nucleotide-binding protein DprA/Smf involved in DNA uptake
MQWKSIVPFELNPSDDRYPKILQKIPDYLPSTLFVFGDLKKINIPWLSLFCSSKCPGNLILKSYDLSIALQKAGIPVASGFHSPVEEDMLRIALRGEQEILICPARGFEGMQIPTEYHQPLEDGRLILASIFPPKLKRPNIKIAYDRNRFVAALAEKVLVIHAEPGGKLVSLCQEIMAWGKPLYTLDSDHNRPLIEMGAEIYRE